MFDAREIAHLYWKFVKANQIFVRKNERRINYAIVETEAENRIFSYMKGLFNINTEARLYPGRCKLVRSKIRYKRNHALLPEEDARFKISRKVAYWRQKFVSHGKAQKRIKCVSGILSETKLAGLAVKAQPLAASVFYLLLSIAFNPTKTRANLVHISVSLHVFRLLFFCREKIVLALFFSDAHLLISSRRVLMRHSYERTSDRIRENGIEYTSDFT